MSRTASEGRKGVGRGPTPLRKITHITHETCGGIFSSNYLKLKEFYCLQIDVRKTMKTIFNR